MSEKDEGKQRSEDAVDAGEPAAESGMTNVEIGGYNGLDPTRYGDWEKKGRCIDF